MKVQTIALLTVLCYILPSKANQVQGSCHSPQYLEYAKTGMIDCKFPEDVTDILWYNTTDYSNHDPILHYRNMKKTGAGYDSGEFDVHPNGSLIIKNVSLQHNRSFHAVALYSTEVDPRVTDITAVVTRKPLISFPIIDKCGNISNACYSSMDTVFAECSVHNAHPAVTLQFTVRTVDGDRNVSNHVSITSDGQWYTTSVSTRDVFQYSTLLSLLVCKAHHSPDVLESDESVLLAQNGHIDLPSEKIKSIYIARNTRMELNCTEDQFGFIVWMKATSPADAEFQVLLYSVFIGDPHTETYAEGVLMEKTGTLVIPFVDVKDEGVYYCIFGDGNSDGVTVFDVSITVLSVPGYPVVEGCNQKQFCELDVAHEGTLTCTVKGIRPQVQLFWKTTFIDDAAYITFSNQQQTIKETGETFDVSLTSGYSVKDVSRDRLAISCSVTDSNQGLPSLETKVELNFTPANEPTKQDTLPPPSRNVLWIILVAVIAVIGGAIAVAAIIAKKSFGKRRDDVTLQRRTSGSAEQMPMFPAPSFKDEATADLEFDVTMLGEKKELFINQLREKYKDLYDAVQPIPYIRDRLYCVDKIFVEGGIQLLERLFGTEDHWENLTSYTDIFTDPRADFLRLILEGDPGFGKSTITLQIAYDWCNKKDIPKLNQAEILILLRLRQLGGVPSIFKSIKYFLLPQDSKLTESDIRNILTNSQSVVILLDGYDEYPDQDKASDYMEIFSRNMFQQFQVILTTRTSYIPKQCVPQTKRIRLTGFNDNAQEAYISKAVVHGDSSAIEKIKHRIRENPVLIGLCEIPLFFVMFAHMIHESSTILHFNSVTTFFQHMINCFHEHMKIKMADRNVKEYELFENDHFDLDKIAFEGLSGKHQKIVWMKEELCGRLRQPFYDAYIRIGILVEEEVLDIEHNRKGFMKRKTEVRFYHKLFCEWYAAHYLSNYASKTFPIKLRFIVNKMNPFDLQYVYRFACGMSPSAAGKIITRLKQLEGGEKFAVLCLLEQTGNFDTIKGTIRELCYEGVVISGHDSKLLQRSYMQLLEIAAQNDIPIEYVNIYNCLQSVDLSTAAIRTTSGLVLTLRISVKGLAVSLYNREITEDEAIAFLEFSSHCSSLSFLWFTGSVPPLLFKVDSTLKSRNVQVSWQMFKDDPEYTLNLATGRWQCETDGKEPTTADFENMRSKFLRYVESWTDEQNKKEIKRIRGNLRKKAEEQKSNPK